MVDERLGLQEHHVLNRPGLRRSLSAITGHPRARADRAERANRLPRSRRRTAARTRSAIDEQVVLTIREAEDPEEAHLHRVAIDGTADLTIEPSPAELRLAFRVGVQVAAVAFQHVHDIETGRERVTELLGARRSSRSSAEVWYSGYSPCGGPPEPSDRKVETG